MAFQPDNVVRFTVHQRYDNQQCLNVFFYRINDPFTIGATPAQLGELFWEFVQADWRALVSTGVVFDRVAVENLDGDLDYGEYIIPPGEAGGQATGPRMSALCAYGIRLNRTSKLTRHGHKRLVGVCEDLVGEYGVLGTGTQTTLQEVADGFASDVVAGLVTVMHPVIVGFPNDDRPSRVEVNIDTATIKIDMTSQNSRKRGHGA